MIFRDKFGYMVGLGMSGVAVVSETVAAHTPIPIAKAGHQVVGAVSNGTVSNWTVIAAVVSVVFTLLSFARDLPELERRWPDIKSSIARLFRLEWGKVKREAAAIEKEIQG